jgi:hypothetical protein
MRFRLATAPLLIFFCFAAAAGQSGGDRSAELRAKAEAATPADQSRLFIEIARMQFAAAKSDYDSGKAPQAQAALKDLSTAAERATRAAIQSRKRLKNTEIDLRKLTERLNNLKPTLSVDDRAPVQQVIEHLEKLRNELLTQMFSKSK